ncbi:hypothetical protein MKW92_050946 [Papaver armeniacum]|nr:hypothetical protein MKW92_050946 [Papaver armeniacum]
MKKRTSFPTRYLIVLLTFFCTCVCYIERVGSSIAYTVAADAAGVDQSTKGIILSTFYYGYACSQVPGGWAAQRIGGRRVLLFSFILWSLTCFMLARLLVGVAQGFIFPSIHTVLAQWVPPHERSRSVSLTTSGMYLGAAAGMLVLPSLAALGGFWSILWLKYSSDPPRSEHPKATASAQKMKVENGGSSTHVTKIPWKKIMLSLPVWAIVVNNFTFHYALYLSLQDMGSSKMLPYLNMFIFSNIGGVVADHLITSKIMSLPPLALMALPRFRTSDGAVFCSSVALGFLALGRAGFAVNHMDVAPRYAGIVMGISNTAGTLAGIVGSTNSDLSSPESWTSVFFIPGYLCIFSSVVFLIFSTGERIFD